MKSKKDEVKEIGYEVDLLDDMLVSLVELLEEKGVITQQEWEDKIKKRVRGKPSSSIRDLKE
jgi:hypothetical protein